MFEAELHFPVGFQDSETSALHGDQKSTYYSTNYVLLVVDLLSTTAVPVVLLSTAVEDTIPVHSSY